MYPGKSIWARGVLALGAGILLLSGLQRWSEATIRKGSGDARSIQVDGSENDDPSIFERSKESARDVGMWQIEDDRRWKRSTRSDRRKEEESIFKDSTEMDAIHEERRASSSIDIGDREIDGDGLLRRNSHVNEADRTLGESSKQDRRYVIMQTDDMPSIDINIVARISSEDKTNRRLIEQEESHNEKDDDQAMIDAASPTLRNDRSEVEETESRSRSKTDDLRSKLFLDVFRSRETSINADNDLRSSTLSIRPIQNSRSADNRDVLKVGASTTESSDRKAGILEANEKSARPSDRRGSLNQDPRILQNVGVENEEKIFPAFSRSIIADKRVKRQRNKIDEIEKNSHFLPGGQASILESSEGNEESARRFAGMLLKDQLIFFHENREGAESSGMRSAETTQDHKNLPYERDFIRRRHEGNLGELEVENIENNDKNNIRETDLSINKEGRSQDAPFQDLNSSEFRDESDDEESSSNASAFQILDSIPSDNKRGKVTRGEDSKDLMIANNFVLASQDLKINPEALISEYRSIFVRNKRKIARNNFMKKMIRSIDRRKNDWRFAGSNHAGSTAIQKADRHETAIGNRRKRRANYYSAQSATPMAYVHIQPAYPAAPPTSRKCVRCMVVYNPCPPKPRPPPRIVLPSYRHHEPASNWRGLKYGE